MVYHIIREEILLIAHIYSRSFRARKNTKQLVKYPRILYCECDWYAYNETRNLIEIRGRGVKITELLLDHNLSYEDNIFYEKLVYWKLNIAFLIYVGKTVHL